MADKITKKEQRDLVIQAGMQLVPYVGGSIASLYFGKKQEKRFKRLESFYQELAQEIKSMKDQIGTVDDQDPVLFEAVMDSLHEKVEEEPTIEKREFFKNYFKNTLKSPIGHNYDERKFFLDALADMSLLECEILAFIRTQPQRIQVGTINKPGIDQYAIVGAIGRLKSRGFLSATQGSFAVGGGGDNTLREQVSITKFGNDFFDFCLCA